MQTVLLPANYRLPIVPGVVDDHARTVFTNGQCHSFAIALHERTGWPIVGVSSCPGELGFGHFMVHDQENELYIDIKGAHTEQEVLDRWGDIGTTDVDDIEYWTSLFVYYELHVDVADEFVGPLLETLRNHREG